MQKAAHIAVVDDHGDIRDLVGKYLEQQGYRVSVADSGAGISAEDLPHIFERFYRADRSRSRHRGGAGLGLAIVKWVVEAHGGQVAVTSAPGSGSQFSLLLPMGEHAADALQFVHDSTTPA